MSQPTVSNLREPLDEPDGFASTEWSMVLTATDGGIQALDRLCRTYWMPVYVFARASGIDRHEAEDATQEFFADMLRRDWLKRVDRNQGSFRAFLRVSVRNFLYNRWRQMGAQKRGGGERPLPLNTEQAEHELARVSIGVGEDPARVYEQGWANCLLRTALDRLGAEQSKNGHAARFEKLKAFLTHQPASGDYAKLSEELNITQPQVAIAVHRLSRRFAELIRA